MQAPKGVINLKLYSAKEAAEFLGISVRTFKTVIKKFGLQPEKIIAHGEKLYSGVQLSLLQNSDVQFPYHKKFRCENVRKFDNKSMQDAKFQPSKMNKKTSKKTEIPKINLNPMKYLVIPVDKLTNVIFDTDKADAEEIIENRKLGIVTPIQLTLPNNSNGKPIPLSPFDKLIFWIALSEQNAGNIGVSYTRIFHSLGGGQKLSNAPRACWQSLNLNHYGNENNEIQKTI